MTTILLYGELAEKFGPVWKLAVSSVGEAIRAIDVNKPGLLAYLAESGERGVDFRVQVDDVDTTEAENLRMNRRIGTIKISPVVRGSKDKWVQVVVGVILIVVAIYTGGGSASLNGWLSGPAFGIEGGVSYAGLVLGLGVSLTVGGLAQVIAGTPKAPSSVDDSGKQSYLFNGPENTTTQGGPVPLCYGGPILVGSQVISAGIYTEDTYIAPTVQDNGDDISLDGPFYNR